MMLILGTVLLDLNLYIYCTVAMMLSYDSWKIIIVRYNHTESGSIREIGAPNGAMCRED